jgi:hypothetical protein
MVLLELPVDSGDAGLQAWNSIAPHHVHVLELPRVPSSSLGDSAAELNRPSLPSYPSKMVVMMEDWDVPKDVAQLEDPSKYEDSGGGEDDDLPANDQQPGRRQRREGQEEERGELQEQSRGGENEQRAAYYGAAAAELKDRLAARASEEEEPGGVDLLHNATSASSAATSTISRQASTLKRSKRRPAKLDNDAVLRLLGEAYRQLIGGGPSTAGELSDEQMDQWMQQLLEWTSSGKGDTVVMLYEQIQQQQSWIKLGDVYNALVYLREKYGGKRPQK